MFLGSFGVLFVIQIFIQDFKTFFNETNRISLLSYTPFRLCFWG
jgi:hypothetical protein